MKKVFSVLILALVIAGIAAAQARAGGTMYVAIKDAQLKSGTGFFAGNTGTLNYGDQVKVIKIEGNFAEVQGASATGWIAMANLSAKRLTSGNTGTVSASETAMAGRGFNKEVEGEYKKQNRNLNFADVDKVETIKVSEADLKKFLEEGRLRMGN